MSNTIYMAPMEGLTDFTYRNAYEKTFGKGRITKYFTPFISPNKSENFLAREIRDIDRGHNKDTYTVAQVMKIYLYKKGFLHSKLMVCDDELSTVGSTNMDFRSFEHNFEANAFFYDKETAMTLKEIFLADQKDCFLLSARIWEKRSWKNKITESVVRLLAPLL